MVNVSAEAKDREVDPAQVVEGGGRSFRCFNDEVCFEGLRFGGALKIKFGHERVHASFEVTCLSADIWGGDNGAMRHVIGEGALEQFFAHAYRLTARHDEELGKFTVIAA